MYEQPNAEIKLVDHYQLYLGQALGKGQFGCVYKAKDLNTKQFIAAKQIKIKETQVTQEYLKNIEESQEVRVMKSLKCENIIKLYDLKFTVNNYYLFMDYCDGGTLKQFLINNRNLNDIQIVEFIQQISNGFKELYQNNIMHRDLKPDNILIHDGVYKIGDFGFAKFYDGDKDLQNYHTLKGTPMYVAPQLFDGGKYSFKSDVWSFGVIIYEMMYGEHPYKEVKTITQLQQKFKQLKQKAGVILPPTDRIESIKEFLQKLLMYNEQDRYSWQEVLDHDINKLSAREFLQIFSVQNKRPIDIPKIQPIIIPTEIGEFYENQIKQSSQIFKDAIQDIQLGRDSYRTMRLKAILMLLWKFQIETLLKIMNNTILLKDNQLQQQQQQFSRQDYCKCLIEYLTNLLEGLNKGIELQKFCLLQKFDKSDKQYMEIDKVDNNYFLNVLKQEQTNFDREILDAVIQATKQIISYY